MRSKSANISKLKYASKPVPRMGSASPREASAPVLAQWQTARGRAVRQKVKNAPCPYPTDNRTNRGSNFLRLVLRPSRVRLLRSSNQSRSPRRRLSKIRLRIPQPALELPITFERRTGDLDGMVKRREIRALVVPSRSGFFYDKGHPQGIYFEALDEFQRFVNKRFRTGSLKINVTYIPVRPEQLENALTEGVGDVIAYGVQVTPEREKKVLFTTPIDSNVKQVIVTGPNAPPIASSRRFERKRNLRQSADCLLRKSAGFERVASKGGKATDLGEKGRSQPDR